MENEQQNIDDLRKEIIDLKAQLDELTQAVKAEWLGSVKHFQELYDRHKKTHDYTISSIDDISRAVTLDRTSTTEHIKELYKKHSDTVDDISTLYNMVVPIEKKIFPYVSKARQQLFALLEKSRPPQGESDQDKKP